MVTDDGTSWHPVINLTEQLKTIDTSNREDLHVCLSKLSSEYNKSLAHRVLAASRASAFLTLMDCYQRISDEDTESKVQLLSCLSSFLHNQPDHVTYDAMDTFLTACQSEHDQICLYGTRLIKYSCVMHETNRQSFVGKHVLISELLCNSKFYYALSKQVKIHC